MQHPQTKTLLIGATSEIGTAISEHLAKKSLSLLMTGRNENKLASLMNSIDGESHHTLSRDYLNVQTDEKLFSSIDAFDGVVLITPRPSLNRSCTPSSEEWRELFEVCFTGPMEVLRQAIPKLSRGSKIILISGITSVQYYPALPQFAVIRNMWKAQAKALSNELGINGISVNTLSLGGVWSKRLEQIIRAESEKTGKSVDELRSHRVNNVPLRDYAELSEIAYVVENMLGEMTNHISGQNIVLDGGFVSAY